MPLPAASGQKEFNSQPASSDEATIAARLIHAKCPNPPAAGIPVAALINPVDRELKADRRQARDQSVQTGAEDGPGFAVDLWNLSARLLIRTIVSVLIHSNSCKWDFIHYIGDRCSLAFHLPTFRILRQSPIWQARFGLSDQRKLNYGLHEAAMPHPGSSLQRAVEFLFTTDFADRHGLRRRTSE